MAALLLAFGLRVANVRSAGNGNAYYAATVHSMLMSPGNLLFAAAEPGGSVSVDKPPLGFWVQALSVRLFGSSTFALIWPQVVAGVLSAAVAARLARKHFGSGAGLVAATVLAVMPVSVAVDRNNTIDSLLIFTLLLAAWAFLRASESTRSPAQWLSLLAGSLLIGAAFNIKMLQALLPVPAFFALYFLGNSGRWWRKLPELIVAAVVACAVSLSWAILVDLTPADRRPYVGSSATNSALELITGYNGLARLFGPGTANGPIASPAAPPDGALPPAYDAGQPGVFRFASLPLVKEVGWLLPLGLFSLALLVVRGRSAGRRWLPLSRQHRAAVLWGGWLLTGLVFFSLAGFMHAYYVALLGPPLAVLAGAGMAELWRMVRQQGWVGWIGWLLVEIVAALTLAAQWGILVALSSSPLGWIAPAAIFVVCIGLLALGLWKPHRLAGPWRGAAFAGVALSLLVLPIAWAFLTAAEPQPDVHLPSAYAGDTGFGQMRRALAQRPGGDANPVLLVLYLEPHTYDVEYVLAVPDANAGADFVLATRRPVLYIGGFQGTDPVVSVDELAAMVNAGRLRYVWDAGDRLHQLKPQIAEWLDESCVVVPASELKAVGVPDLPGSPLYQCGEATASGLDRSSSAPQPGRRS